MLKTAMLFNKFVDSFDWFLGFFDKNVLSIESSKEQHYSK